MHKRIAAAALLMLAISAQAAPVRVALITGGHWIDEEAAMAMFDAMVDVEVTRLHQNDGDEFLDYVFEWPHDVMVFYNISATIPDARFEALRSLLDRGVGLVVMHHAVLSYGDRPEAAEIMGRRLHHDGPFGFHPNQEYTVEIADPTHPITQGMEDFVLRDETFTSFHGENLVEGNTPVLVTSHDKAERVVAWRRTYGHARVAGFQPGHDAEALGNPSVRRVLNNLILWCAGRIPDAPGGEALKDSTRRLERWEAWMMEGAAAYTFGAPRFALDELEAAVTASLTQPEKRAALATKLGVLLRREGPEDGKREILGQLARLAQPETVVDAAPFLGEPALFPTALATLEKIPGKLAFNALAKALRESSGDAALVLVQAFGARGESAAVPILVRVAGDPEREDSVRAEAMAALGRLPHTGALEALQRLDAPPGLLEDALGAALLARADAVRKQDQGSEAALGIYRNALKKDGPVMQRVHGLEGLVAMLGDGALEDVLAALASEEPALREAAAGALAAFQQEASVTAFLEAVDAKAPGLCLAVMESLAASGGPAGRPFVLHQLREGNEGMRAAALRALAHLGEAGDAPYLAGFLWQGTAAEQAAARHALARMDDAGTDRTLAAMLEGAPAGMQTALLAVLGDRHAAGEVSRVLVLAREGSQEVQAGAWRALGAMAEPAHLSAMLEALASLSNEALAEAARDGLLALCKRHPRMEEVIAAFEAEAAEQRMAPWAQGVLLDTAQGLGTPEALVFIEARAGALDSATRGAALSALAEWEDPPQLEVLAGMAEASAGEHRAPAVSALIEAVARHKQVEASERAAYLAKAMNWASGSDQRVRALEVAGDIPHIAALPLATGALEESALVGEAASAVASLAPQLGLEHAAPVAEALARARERVAGDSPMHRRLSRAAEELAQFKERLVAQWSFEEGLEGWKAAHACEARAENGRMIVEANGEDPFLEHAWETGIPAGDVVIELRARFDVKGATQFFWASTDGPALGEMGSWAVIPTGPDGPWEEYRLPVSMPGRLEFFRIDPGGWEGHTEIDWIRIVRPGSPAQ